MSGPLANSAASETANPLVPVGWDIVGVVLSLVVTAAIVATVLLLICSARRNRRGRRD